MPRKPYLTFNGHFRLQLTINTSVAVSESDSEASDSEQVIMPRARKTVTPAEDTPMPDEAPADEDSEEGEGAEET